MVYAAMAVVVEIMDEDDGVRWGTTLQAVLLLGAIWAVIGAGIWVKHKWSGKLPEPSA